jgi:outer membrane biosynthesis protein TonB
MAEREGSGSHGRTSRLAAVGLGLSALLPFCLAALPLVLTGCAHAAAKTTPDMPALAMPPPPPHDVEAVEVEPPPPVPLATEPARNTPARARPAPAPRPEPPKAEPPKPDQPAVVEPPTPPEEPPPHPPTTLQTTPATAEGEVERNIRASLQRASADLNRVDYRALNADARIQYDQAKRFVRQADDAIRTKNLVFAKNLAEKAATIAAQLAGR